MTDPNLILDETGTILRGIKDKAITSVNIPSSVTIIGEYAFYGCTSLQTVVIPDTVTTIGYCVFEGCASLQAIIVAEGNDFFLLQMEYCSTKINLHYCDFPPE